MKRRCWDKACLIAGIFIALLGVFTLVFPVFSYYSEKEGTLLGGGKRTERSLTVPEPVSVGFIIFGSALFYHSQKFRRRRG